MNQFELYEFPVASACFKVIDTPETNIDYCFTTCNHAFIQLFGSDVTGVFFSNLPDNLAGLFNETAKKISSKTSRFVFDDGALRKYDVRLSVCDDIYTVFVTDLPSHGISDENRLQIILNSISTCVITADQDGKIQYINSAAKSLTEWNEEAIGEPISTVLKVSITNSLPPVNILSETELNSADCSNDMVLMSKNGKAVDITLSIRPLEGLGGYIVFFHDISKQLKLEQEVSFLNYHDRLTGLYNRPYFEKKLQEFDKEHYCPVSIIMGDVNGLKMTNDVFGQQQGDLLLVTIANIFSLACRESDVIARYGGDEFVVIMPNTPLEEAARICKNILNLCQSKTCDQNKVSVSLGYSCKSSASENMGAVLSIAEDYMCRHKLLESSSYRSSFISSLKSMLFERSFETEEHAMRLTGLCAEAGRLIGLSQNDMNDLELLCMLHDIGKIGVKDQVLLKPGKLTDEEWVEMRKHSLIGYRIARSTPELSHIADYILCHHERFDGTGYPQGLRGDQIPLLSRILSVADSYDAMVNDRYYRKALSVNTAISELKRCSGTQFDPEIVKVFLKILEPKTDKVSA